MKRSAGERSTSGEAHSERQVPSRSAPFVGRAGERRDGEPRELPGAGAERAAAAAAGQRTPRPPIASSVSPA